MPIDIPVEFKIQLLTIGNYIITALQYVCMLAVLAVAVLELKYGKQHEHRSRVDIAVNFIFGLLITLFFFYMVGFPWHKFYFWLSGAGGLVFGFFLTLAARPDGFEAGKLHIKNNRIYGVAWALTLLVGEFYLAYLDPQGTGASSPLLFGFTALGVVTSVNLRRYHQHRRQHRASLAAAQANEPSSPAV